MQKNIFNIFPMENSICHLAFEISLVLTATTQIDIDYCKTFTREEFVASLIVRTSLERVKIASTSGWMEIKGQSHRQRLKDPFVST